VFAKLDLLSDPPFSRLDLIICRNLLIYLEPDAQEKCISLFNYALNNSGYLFLGNAESVGLTGKNLFRSLGHKKCRIYQKTETAAAIKSPFAVPFAAERAAASSFRGRPAFEVRQEAVAAIQEALLEEFVPAMVAIDQNYNILYHNGPTNRYLRHPRGTPTWNLLELLPDEVRVRLRGALHRAEKETKPVAVRLPLHGDASGKKYASLRISKLRENIYSIIFRDKAGSSGQADADDAEITAGEETAVRQLETELIATRQDLQNHIEQLKSLNEEIQSSNEELQAANEELETSREELQSLNEELVTVNTQLQSKIEEQEETNSDLNNFLESTNIPTLFLDRKLRVKRFTPAMLKLIKLIPADIERPIIDMSRENLGSDLLLDAEAVLESLLSIKRDLTINGSWYIRTTLPYRTFDGRIGGVVITYSDITDLKQVQEKLSVAKDDWERTFDSVPDLIAILDSNHLVRRVNRAMAQRLGLKPEQCIGLPCYEAVHGLSAPPPFCPHSRTIADSLEHVEEVHESRLGGDFVVSTTPLYDDQGRMTGSVHVAHDITERKKAEDALRESRERLDLALLSSRMATFDWDIINNKRTWSNGVHGLLGTKPETFTGSAEEFFQIMHPEDRSTVQAALARAVETTGEYETEYRAVWPDGSIHYIAARGRVHRDNAGRAVLMTGVCWDITGRKKAEEAVQESEERFRNMFEHHKAVMLLVEPGSGAIVDANTAAADFYKQSREGLRASNIQDINLLPPEEVAAEREKAATEERSHFIFPHRIADGEVRWVEVYSTPIQVGRTPVLFSIIHDITGRREAEEQIRQHVEDLRSNNEELERLNRAMVGRELRMIELKKEINECCRREGQPPRYNLDFEKEQP
jgi:two-component system CheB/CheR fusion protein